MSTPLIPVSRPDVGLQELKAVQEIFDTGWLGHGAAVIDFENELSRILGGRRVVAVSTGTAALHLALESLEIKPGDEIILPSLTFCSCPQVVTQIGATPVFCDVSDQTLTIDISDLRKCISRKTRAIMPVHFCSSVCDMTALQDIVRDSGIRIVEDAAHAFGCSYKGSLIGSIGDITCFSFDPIKNLTCGEGGAIVLSDSDLAEKMSLKRMMGVDRDGWKRSREGCGYGYAVITQGFRYHMSNINAAIGMTQLSRFSELSEKRRRIAKKYHGMLNDIPAIRFPAWDIDTVVPFALMIRIKNGLRDGLREHLLRAGVQTAVHYSPNHLQPAFAKYHRILPVTEIVALEIMSLPLFPSMSDKEIEHVANEIRFFFGFEMLSASVTMLNEEDCA
jgi:dTDP-4-amino-4,6-dideoxygalactose transaminase